MSDCKIFLRVVGVIAIWGVVFYFAQLYYFFYVDVLKTENAILRNQFPYLLPNAKEEYVSTWGAFGDFVGGTLNPIIGLISVLLLFATWLITSKTLDVSKKELRNSNELLSNQQFDAIFWGLFHNLKRIEEILYKTGDYGQIKINEIYHDVFRCQFSGRDKDHSSRREKILKNAELSQYFICLYQIFKNIDGRISLDNKEEEQKIKKAYSNILRASTPTKLLQLLAVNCHEEFEKYKRFLEDSNFLEHMPFYIIEHEKSLNLGLIECIVTYDEKVFDKSIYFKEFKTKDFLNIFFEKKIQNYKLYINNYLMKKFNGEKFIENKNIDLKIYLDWNRANFQLAWWGSCQGQEMLRETCSWYVSMS
nr:putative phage abortive infection protein [Acinetobacter sp. ANC5681]